MTELSAPDAVVTVAAPGGWLDELLRRLRHRAWLKLAGVSAFMWLFFIAYFQILRHPARPVTTMPLTPLDHWIPFQPAWLAAYLSLWLYVSIAPGLMLRLRSMLGHGLMAAALCLAGLACFYFWPTAVPAVAVDLQANPALAVLHGVDAAGNACPSLHVAAAMFSALWIGHLLRRIQAPAALRLANAAWFLAIAYSTLAIKQHVALDVLAGVLLGAAFAWPALRPAPREGRR